MNAQFPITTTPKYNFPLLQENLQLPTQLIELSVRSLKKMQRLQMSFATNPTPQSTVLEFPKHFFPSTKLVKLKPNHTKTPVVAIDVSSIKLGETKRGILLAVRGAITWKQANRYRYLRLGPFPFHITEQNTNEIRRLLHQPQQATNPQEYAISTAHVQTKLTTLLERWIQTSINQTSHNSLILWDGSLTAGTSETSIQTMKQLLENARTRQNVILAFSKMTRLLYYGHRITDLVRKDPPPCLLKIRNYPVHKGPMQLMGDIYVAKLTEGNCAFRLDVDKQLSSIEAVDAVQKLLGNDLILMSYPETLRLAHIFSTFTAAEVLGIQRCIAKESNIKILTKPNVRRMLFGRFGKGPEG